MPSHRRMRRRHVDRARTLAGAVRIRRARSRLPGRARRGLGRAPPGGRDPRDARPATEPLGRSIGREPPTPPRLCRACSAAAGGRRPPQSREDPSNTRLWPSSTRDCRPRSPQRRDSSAGPRPARLSHLAFSLPSLADLAPRVIDGNHSQLARLGRGPFVFVGRQLKSLQHLLDRERIRDDRATFQARSLFQVKFVHNVARLGGTPAGRRRVKAERERAPG